MENRSDIEKRLGEKLEAAYMLEETPQGMSREDFHRLIQAAEKKKKRRRNMLSLAAACVALCLVCGGFVAGMTLGESATAGKDGEKKTVQQGDSVVIGSGVSENDQNVGMSTKTYTNIEDIPEDIRKEIHFLDVSSEYSVGLVFKKVNISKSSRITKYSMAYDEGGKEILITIIKTYCYDIENRIIPAGDDNWIYNGIKVSESKVDDGIMYSYEDNSSAVSIMLPNDAKIKIEAILDDLMGC